jgi:hypothetical protein
VVVMVFFVTEDQKRADRLVDFVTDKKVHYLISAATWLTLIFFVVW